MKGSEKDKVSPEFLESCRYLERTHGTPHPHDSIEDGKKLPKAMAEIARLKQEKIELKEKNEKLVEACQMFLDEYEDVKLNTPIAYYKVIKKINEALNQ